MRGHGEKGGGRSGTAGVRVHSMLMISARRLYISRGVKTFRRYTDLHKREREWDAWNSGRATSSPHSAFACNVLRLISIYLMRRTGN